MRVAIRADSSLRMGLGHVMRCLTLAHQLAKLDFDVYFICREFKGNVIRHIQENGFEVKVLTSKDSCKQTDENWLGVDSKEDALQTLNVLADKPCDVILIDQYGIDAEWEYQIAAKVAHVIVIDDLANREHYCDVLIDQTYGINNDKYQGLVPESCNQMLGAQYAMLRSEFAKNRELSLTRRELPRDSKRLLVSLGGTDPNNLTMTVIEMLIEFDMQFAVDVIVGENYPDIQTLKKLMESSGHPFNLHINVSNMAELMSKADLAIGTAGTSSWERCCLGLPAIVFIEDDNQALVGKNLQKVNAIRLASMRHDDWKNKLQADLNELMFDDELLCSMSKSAANVCDGKGAIRLARNIAMNLSC